MYILYFFFALNDSPQAAIKCFQNRKNKNALASSPPPRPLPPIVAFGLHSYAPLSVRLVQACVRPGWALAADALKALPGPCVEITQDPDSPLEDLPAAREIFYFIFICFYQTTVESGVQAGTHTGCTPGRGHGIYSHKTLMVPYIDRAFVWFISFVKQNKKRQRPI